MSLLFGTTAIAIRLWAPTQSIQITEQPWGMSFGHSQPALEWSWYLLISSFDPQTWEISAWNSPRPTRRCIQQRHSPKESTDGSSILIWELPKSTPFPATALWHPVIVSLLGVWFGHKRLGDNFMLSRNILKNSYSLVSSLTRVSCLRQSNHLLWHIGHLGATWWNRKIYRDRLSK